MIGRVAGAGESNDMLLYSFEDDRPLSSLSYYRLRQVDYDGTSSYSQIVAIDPWSTGFATYPNPTKDMLSLRLPGQQSWQAAIYDIRGEVVKTWIIQDGFEQVSLGHLPAGEYILKLQNGRSSQQTILIKSD